MERSAAEMRPPVEDSDTATVSPRATRRAVRGAARPARSWGTAWRIARGLPPRPRFPYDREATPHHSSRRPHMGQLDGKVAIVTGSGRGIGREGALRVARDGANVVVNDLDDEPARATIELLEKLRPKAVACVGNVTATDFGDRIVDTAVKQLGGVHVIVNNAGYTWDNVIQKMTDEQWYTIIDVHVTAPFRILRAFANYVRPAVEAETKAGQRVVRKIVNVSSTSGTNGNAGQVNYSAGKAAMVGVTKTLAKEWGRYNVTVNC